MLSYFLTFNVVYLRQAGLAADAIGVFQAILVAPFALKLVFGVLSDRFSLFGLGHRYPYIVLGLSLQCGAFLVLPMLAIPQQLDAFFWVLFTATTGMALYDTGTDGLAVETTPDAQRGRVQGVMVGARSFGLLLTTLFGGWLAAHDAWPALFTVVSGSAVPALLLALLFWERREITRPAGFDWSAFRLLLRGETLMLATIGVIYTLALDGVLSFLSYHPDAGGIADLGLVSGLVAVAMLGRLLGAAVSAWLTDRFGRRRSMQWAIVASALACVGLGGAQGAPMLAVACLVFGAVYGFFTTVYCASAMARSDPRIAASMFAVFMMFLNIGIATGQALGGALTQAGGFWVLALTMAGISLVNLLFVRRV